MHSTCRLSRWLRGDEKDPRAIDLIRAAHPAAPCPAFLASPAGVQLCLAPGVEELEAAVALVRDAAQNDPAATETLRRAHRGSAVWLVVKDDRQGVVGTARAISDGGDIASILDVVVAPEWRGLGIGTALVKTVLDHPRVRRARMVRVAGHRAWRFYAPLGFRPSEGVEPRLEQSELVLKRSAGHEAF